MRWRAGHVGRHGVGYANGSEEKLMMIKKGIAVLLCWLISD